MKHWMKGLALAALALTLGACSNMGRYYESVEHSNATNVEIAKARYQADIAKYMVMKSVADSGDTAAKVAVVMAMAFENAGGQNTPKPTMPAQPQNEALQWASLIVPGIVQLGSGYFNLVQNTNASDNARILGLSTNSTFGMMAQEINDPTIVTQPAPTIVTQPAPVIVTQPPPTIVNPVIVDPVVVQPTIVPTGAP